MDDATKALALPKEATGARGASVVVLRVGTTYLGLPSRVVSQVFDCLTVRRIPHTDPALAGLVVLDGVLMLCVNLEKILGGEPPSPDGGRMLAVDTGWKWVFRADEVLGLEQVPESNVKPPPATLMVSHTLGVFQSAGREVALLDAAMLEKELTGRLGVRGKNVARPGAAS
jgi:chemotaxis signal transduction protein